MALTLYADAQDVRDAFEGTIPNDTKNNTRLDALLRRASGKLQGKVPGLDNRMARGLIDPEVVTGMVVEAVLRVWRNPAGATQQGVGPFQLSLNKTAQLNEITFDDNEIAWLKGELDFVPSTLYVRYPGRLEPPDGSVDVGRYRHLVWHVTGL